MNNENTETDEQQHNDSDSYKDNYKNNRSRCSDRDLTTFEPFQEARLLLWEIFEFRGYLKQGEKDFLNDLVAKLGVYHSLTEKQKNAVYEIMHRAKCRKQVSDKKKRR